MTSSPLGLCWKANRAVSRRRSDRTASDSRLVLVLVVVPAGQAWRFGQQTGSNRPP